MFPKAQPECLSTCSKQVDEVIMIVYHITQCCPDMDPDVPPQLRSEAYEELEIRYEEEVGSRHHVEEDTSLYD